jgi:L-threonylcarbamoyladenylate synthase
MKYAFDKKGLQAAAKVLKAGGLIAFPTDTVYGLGTNALKREGFDRLYALKGRDPGKPLAVLIESLSHAAVLGHFDPRALNLARAFWPGPLTLVLRVTALGRKAALGAGNIGLRVPDHPGMRALLKTAPMAATSANRSGEPECRTADEVEQRLGWDLDCILDGGTVDGKPSTIVDLTGEEPKFLREGQLSRKQILEAMQ